MSIKNKLVVKSWFSSIFMPIFLLLTSLLGFSVFIFIYSNTYAVVTYSSETNTSTSFTSGQGYSVSLTA